MALSTKLTKKLRGNPILISLPFDLGTLFHRLTSSSSCIYRYPSSLLSSSSFSTSQPQIFTPPQYPATKPSVYGNQFLHQKIISFQNEPKERDSNVDRVVDMLRKTNCFSSKVRSIDFVDVELTEDMVCSVIWELREDWELAMLALRSSEKKGCNHSRAWDFMVWVLGQQKRFATAWGLIRKMSKSSMNPRTSLLIMIESYAFASCPRKSIQTFEAMEKFKISQDTEAFYTLLQALCKNGNIEEAEEFMQLNKSLFPLQTESFNIILNGWCNISVDLVEAKRVWREMSSCCITPDATSYTQMISCVSKLGDLFSSLRLYDEMKKRGWVPGLDVYNSLIYVLTSNNCLKEAFNVVDKINEAGLQPDSTTYNSMILPLCEAHKLEKAKIILTDMVQMGLTPTPETYHAFIEVESADGTVELLKQMKEARCGPYGNTFLLTINKLLQSKQPDDALRIWAEMIKYDLMPDSAHYSAMVKGLVVCGWHAKARKFYDDMKSRGFPDDSTINKLFKDLIGGCGKHQEWDREEDTQKTRKKGRTVRNYRKPMRHKANCKKNQRAV
ncbi:Pentatricopeptide repeat-containing protein [Thalictrum thalictroides]|uniref:Pentatricopeptide repeat-containing protein n=1 Tax=Thalictrum thalictroides TaxID=46969 RepID=A0A7J6V8Y2_THATH|nr:Pentatricopeptide repeat-containing protein [Thalictrum thalictroides]